MINYFIKLIVNGYLYASPFEAFAEAYIMSINSITFKKQNNKTVIIAKIMIPEIFPAFR